ncbi:FUSC family protein [Enterovibrio calviensis]|uniref:FUSC family protein n=1 Tax=Enterovibrio calviensis TaxID=91359 RepID=UPI000489F3CB|nr:FUSC family protein [Enterovibrio calviensis]
MTKYASFAHKHDRLLYMVRVTLVMGLILGVVRVFNVPYGYWALITAVTILGAIPFVGGVLSKAKQRIAGTMMGGALGLALFLIPPEYHWTHHVAFFALLIAAMYFTQEHYAYAALMAAVTIVIVAGGGPADFEAAGWRMLNVLWAGVVAVVVSVFVFPAKATDEFLFLLESFMRELNVYYTQHIESAKQGVFKPAHADRLNTLVDKQQSILPHALKESGVHTPALNTILLIEKRLYAELEALISAQWDAQQGKDEISELDGLINTQYSLAMQFDALAQQISNKEVTAVDQEDIGILNLTSDKIAHPKGDSRDISYFGYLWLNREMARQFAQLTVVTKKVFAYQ